MTPEERDRLRTDYWRATDITTPDNDGSRPWEGRVVIIPAPRCTTDVPSLAAKLEARQE
jgi:hypothetical protein